MNRRESLVCLIYEIIDSTLHHRWLDGVRLRSENPTREILLLLQMRINTSRIRLVCYNYFWFVSYFVLLYFQFHQSKIVLFFQNLSFCINISRHCFKIIFCRLKHKVYIFYFLKFLFFEIFIFFLNFCCKVMVF